MLLWCVVSNCHNSGGREREARTEERGEDRRQWSGGASVEMLAVLCLCLCACLPPAFSSSVHRQGGKEQAHIHHVSARQAQTEAETEQTARAVRQQVQRCVSMAGERGRCVSLESCVLPDIYKDYVKNKNYFCVLASTGAVGVCCPDSNKSPLVYQPGVFTQTNSQTGARPGTSRPPQTQQPTVRPTTTTTVVRPNRDTPPTFASDDLPEEIYPVADFRVCGRNGKLISRITSASRTTLKDWPWMAALIYRRTLKQFCGGTLITRRHVLTAAHCFPRADPDEVLVLLGDYDLKKTDDSKSRLFSVVQMTIHEEFDVTTYEHDITILTLNSTTTYNSFIQPCCMPFPGLRYTNSTAVITGWGKLEFGGPSANVLQEVPVPVWEQDKCAPNFAQTIFDTNLCAGAFEGGKDACQGDSGGPLVIQRKDQRWVIIGIVSWGIGCGDKNKPGIYTRVNDYLDWIAQTVL